jgi:hypothetical protein
VLPEADSRAVCEADDALRAADGLPGRLRYLPITKRCGTKAAECLAYASQCRCCAQTTRDFSSIMRRRFDAGHGVNGPQLMSLMHYYACPRGLRRRRHWTSGMQLKSEYTFTSGLVQPASITNTTRTWSSELRSSHGRVSLAYCSGVSFK